MDEYNAFITENLIPEARKILYAHYDAHCNGADIGIEIKADQSQASLADRETEAALRKIIEQAYPEHGIWGEEHGGARLDREWVWVLDPLDGTREFLQKRTGDFGSLIGLMKNGIPATGGIIDPIAAQVWLPQSRMVTPRRPSAEETIIACTNLNSMFDASQARALSDACTHIISGRNCMGFVDVLEGRVDAFVENRLYLHDLASVLPIIAAAGLVAMDLSGRHYSDMAFDPASAATQTYGVIVSANEGLAQDLVSLLEAEEAA